MFAHLNQTTIIHLDHSVEYHESLAFISILEFINLNWKSDFDHNKLFSFITSDLRTISIIYAGLH